MFSKRQYKKSTKCKDDSEEFGSTLCECQFCYIVKKKKATKKPSLFLCYHLNNMMQNIFSFIKDRAQHHAVFNFLLKFLSVPEPAELFPNKQTGNFHPPLRQDWSLLPTPIHTFSPSAARRHHRKREAKLLLLTPKLFLKEQTKTLDSTHPMEKASDASPNV